MKKIIQTILRAWQWIHRRVILPTAKWLVRVLQKFIQHHEQD